MIALPGISPHAGAIKWTASLAQIAGYGATAMGAAPVNLWFFLIGLIGWFIVGVI